MKNLIKFHALTQRGFKGCLLCLLSFALLSCIGVNADIVFNADNSGSITLEYRVNHALMNLGQFDSNEAYPILPLGRNDFERTLSRVPGLSLVSHNIRTEDLDTVIRARLRFADIDALLGFLDQSGRGAIYVNEHNSQKLILVLGTGHMSRNNDIDDFIRDISASYNISFSFSFPAEASLALLDDQGQDFNAAIHINPRGRNIGFSVALENVLYADNGLIAQIVF